MDKRLFKQSKSMAKISTLRDMLKKRNSLKSLSRTNILNSSPGFPNIKVPVSRDISHIKDPKQPTRTSFQSHEELLQSIVSPTLEIREEPNLNLGVSLSAQKDDDIEEQFYFLIGDFIEEAIFTSEGLLTYKHHTQLVSDTLLSVYGITLPDIKPKQQKSDHKMTNPSSRQEVKLLSSWLSCMFSQHIMEENTPVHQKINVAQVTLKAALKELIGQVKVQCFERGDLLDRVIDTLEIVVNMSSFREQSRIKELEGFLLQQKREYESTLTEKVSKIRAKSLRHVIELSIKTKKIQKYTKENEDLTNVIQTLRKRIDALQTEADILSKNTLIKYYPYSPEKQQIVLKRHATTVTDDADFPSHTHFSAFYVQPPLNRPLLLVGSFENRTSFRKTSAYIAVNSDKIIPYDFPSHLIVVPYTKDASTATVENSKAQDYIRITPNVRRESEAEEIVHCSDETNSIQGTTVGKMTRACQIPTWKLVLQLENAGQIGILQKKRTDKRTTRKKAIEARKKPRTEALPNRKATQKSDSRYHILKQPANPLHSRANSLNSLSFSSSKSIAPVPNGKTELETLSEELLRFNQNLNEIIMNGGSFEDLVNDEDYQIQSLKVKSFIDKLQKCTFSAKQEFTSLKGKFSSQNSIPEAKIEQFFGNHLNSPESFLSADLPREYKHNVIEDEAVFSCSRVVLSSIPSEDTNPVGGNLKQELSIRIISPNEERNVKRREILPVQNHSKSYQKETKDGRGTRISLNSKSKPDGIHRRKSTIPFETVRRPSTSYGSVYITPKVMVSPSTAIQTVIFNKKPRLEISHSGPLFLNNYLLYIGQQVSIHSPITLSSLLKIINKSYMAKFQTMKDTSKSRALPLSAVLYDLLHKIYGLKSVAEQKMRHVILGCVAFSGELERVKNFGRFLGIPEECSIGDFNFYIQYLEFTSYITPPSLLVNHTGSGEQSALYERILMFIDCYFKPKLPFEEYREVLSRIHEMKLEQLKKLPSKQVFTEIVDVDKTFSLLINYFHRLIKRVGDYLVKITGNLWEEDKLFTYNEFFSVIAQLSEMPEATMTTYFSIYKEKLELTKQDVLTLESVILFVKDNSLLDFFKVNEILI